MQKRRGSIVFDDAMALHFVWLDLTNRDGSRIGRVAGAHQLRGDRFIADHNDVGKQDGKRLVAEDGAGDADGMSETERLLLLDIFELYEVTQRVEFGLHLVKLTLAEKAFELGIGSKIGLKQSSVFANNQDDGFDSTRGSFLDRVLDQRFAGDGQHFLRQNFSGGKHASAITRCRDHCLGDFLTSGQALPPWGEFAGVTEHRHECLCSRRAGYEFRLWLWAGRIPIWFRRLLLWGGRRGGARLGLGRIRCGG